MTPPLPVTDFPHGFAIDMRQPGAGEAVRGVMARMARPTDAAGARAWDRRQDRVAQFKACATLDDRTALQARFRAEDDQMHAPLVGADFIRYLGRQYPTVWTAGRVDAAVAVRAERVVIGGAE